MNIINYLPLPGGIFIDKCIGFYRVNGESVYPNAAGEALWDIAERVADIECKNLSLQAFLRYYQDSDEDEAERKLINNQQYTSSLIISGQLEEGKKAIDRTIEWLRQFRFNEDEQDTNNEK